MPGTIPGANDIIVNKHGHAQGPYDFDLSPQTTNRQSQNSVLMLWKHIVRVIYSGLELFISK